MKQKLTLKAFIEQVRDIIMADHKVSEKEAYDIATFDKDTVKTWWKENVPVDEAASMQWNQWNR
jgi:hypothetical protein